MMNLVTNQRMLHDAKGIERCRLCAEATHQFLTTERQVLERRILVLSSELVYLESYINVLELQQCRPPSRQVQLPEQVQRMQTKIMAALKAQHQLIKTIMQYYTRVQMEMVNGGIMAAGHWQYTQNIEEHKAVLLMLQ